MTVCPNCGATNAPGPACAACGHPLPPGAVVDAPDLVPVRTVGAYLLVVGILIAVAGLILYSTASGFWFFASDAAVFGLLVALAGAAAITAGSALLARRTWGWGLAVGVACFGLVYAVAGLARGYSSGLIGLVVWGALGYGLWRADVRDALVG